MDVFEVCQSINESLENKDEVFAREELIKLLDYHSKNDLAYSELLNHLIRKVGLFPYIDSSSAFWGDRFVCEAFKVNVGMENPAILHREQSILLRKLLDGESVAVSAPTSFGKSFVIDAFIALKRPANVVIIVPTLALMDETRRRLHVKFSSDYKLITTPDAVLSERNIFIFPQERAAGYFNVINSIDLLIVDEFYKASVDFDTDRAPALIRTILNWENIAAQRYFLAPNISVLQDNPFTQGMAFVHLDFNTVFLDKKELYLEIGNDIKRKGIALVNILNEVEGKTLIYAGTYPDIERVAVHIESSFGIVYGDLLSSFAQWLKQSYSANWNLPGLVLRKTGIHNGRLHRSLGQIQVRLFSDKSGLKNLISTSSIIEGVNTSAENIILWRNRNGNSKLNDFTYRNIIGRGGRMFKHFIGKIFILEKPPEAEDTSLQLSLPEELLGSIDEESFKGELSEDQFNKIGSIKSEMSELLGAQVFSKLMKENAFFASDLQFVLKIARDLKENSGNWNGLSFLNSENPEDWDSLLYKLIRLDAGAWEAKHSQFVSFIKVLSKNWFKSIPEMLEELYSADIDINSFFKLERIVTFKLAALMTDFNTLQLYIRSEEKNDISPFVSKLAHAFLPPVVHQLEEYGLPRMVSRKIHDSQLLDFEAEGLNIHDVIDMLNSIGPDRIKSTSKGLHEFENYILDFFFEGIRPGAA